MRTLPRLATVLLLLSAAVCVVSAKDEFVTLSDGRTLVLHDNYSWDIKGGSSSGLGGDITVNVYGDKNIVLHEDKTWDFADTAGAAPATNRAKLKSVSATATAGRQTLDEARDAARLSAINKIAQQLRPHTDTAAVSEESLVRCIGVAAVPTTMKQGRSRDKGWVVTLKIAFSKAQIEGVLSCATPEKTE